MIGTRVVNMSPVVVRSLPFGLYIALLAVEGVLPQLGVSEAGLLWLYPLKAVLVALALAVLWSRFSELHHSWPGARGLLAPALLGAVVFLLWINLNEGWVVLGERGQGYIPLDGEGRTDWLLVGFRIAGAALVVPLMEELFWRSFLQRWLQEQAFLSLAPAAVGGRALITASALFAVEHSQWLAGLLAGLVYGGLYIRTGTLWSPVVAHAVTNGLLGVYVVATGAWYYW